MADPRIGQVLDGYLVTDVIGEGGFGRVYRAVSLDDGEPVALKLAGAGPIDVERLLREARALGRIDHPNVVRLLGNGWVGDAPYLALELLDGHESLTDLIDARAERGDGLGQGEVRAILDQLLDGLEAAHAAGVVHRDIKPDNVMIRHGARSLEVKILDFGLAKLRPRVRRRDEGGAARAKTPPHRTLALGTPTHMAPEQLAGRGLGPWTDLWAVGVIAFELLTGALPFDGDSVSALLRQRSDPDHDALALAPWLPSACQRMLRRALDPDPRARFRSVAEMRASLAEALPAAPGPVPLPASRPLLRPVSDPSTELAARPRSTVFGALVPMAVAAALALVAIPVSLSSRADVAPREVAAALDDVGVRAETSAASSVSALAAAPVEPAEPIAPPDPLLEVAARARTCGASAEELRALAAGCTPERGCRPIPLDGELARGARLAVPSDAERVVLVLATGDEADACAARPRRSRAIVGGAWDVIEPAWGAYVQPRVVLEARRGRALASREVLRERGAKATSGAVCLSPDALADARLEAFEELRFVVADTGQFTGEEGRFPCRLEARALALGQPKRPAM